MQGASKVALTTAVGYAITRMGVGSNGESNTAILKYQLQNRALMPLLARTFVLNFALDRIKDEYAAAYGGALLMRFTDCVGVEPLAFSAATAEQFVRRGVVIYTGESRISGEIVAAVRDAYVDGDPRTTAALARMKTLAIEMADVLRAGDLDGLGALLREHWVHQRQLHPRITTPKIETIVETALRHGALGLKALGASGGGCVLAIAEDGREDELAAALAPLGERLRYDIDRDGFQIVAVMDESHAEKPCDEGVPET